MPAGSTSSGMLSGGIFNITPCMSARTVHGAGGYRFSSAIPSFLAQYGAHLRREGGPHGPLAETADLPHVVAQNGHDMWRDSRRQGRHRPVVSPEMLCSVRIHPRQGHHYEYHRERGHGAVDHHPE